jgi:hypothetical protein
MSNNVPNLAAKIGVIQQFLKKMMKENENFFTFTFESHF